MKLTTQFLCCILVSTVACQYVSMAKAVQNENSIVCARAVSSDVHALTIGSSPGTPFENAVSLAALQGNTPELAREIRVARKRNSLRYMQKWLNTALFYAITADRVESAEFLINSGAQLNQRAMYMQLPWNRQILHSKHPTLTQAGTPLATAVTCGHVHMVDLLLNRGADMYTRDSGLNPEHRGNIIYAAVLSRFSPLVDAFLKHGLNPCEVTGRKSRGREYTLAMVAAEYGMSKTMQSNLTCKSALLPPSAR